MLSLTLTADSAIGALLDFAITSVAWIHVFVSPYNKYDHFTFPGVVPRTFIGSILLAAGSYLPLRIGTALGFIHSKLDVQILIRLVLVLFNLHGLGQIRWAVQKRFGVATAALFVVLTCTQFHLPFWIGRTLPNMFALMPVNLATSLFVYPGSKPIMVRRHYRAILCLLGSAAIIFRSELVLLTIPMLAVVLFQHAVPLSFLVPLGAIVAIGSIACTVLVDSYFWDAWSPPMWPELSGIVFNVYEGKSSEWGTSPWHAYLSHHLPKLLLASTPLAAFACVPLPAGITSNFDRKHAPEIARQLLVPSVAFTLLISGLAHKEWRFIVYVVPVVNVVAAIGARRLLELNSKSLRILARLAILGLIGCNIIATTILTTISRANYPGGAALALVNAQPDPQASVWIDNLAAQTGASLFTQDHSAPSFFSNATREWTYSKDPSPASYDAFTYLVTETPDAFPKERWTAIGHVDAFDRIDLKRAVLVTKPALYVLRNNL